MSYHLAQACKHTLQILSVRCRIIQSIGPAHPAWWQAQHRYAHSAAVALKVKEPYQLTHSSDNLAKASTVQLRPYQEECLTSIQEALARNVSRIGVSSPTGSGKTTIFAELIDAIPSPSATCHRVLILVSSIQLATQAATHISRRYPDLWVEIEQGAKYKASGFADVTVATWQTLISIERSQKGDTEYMERLRLEKFDPAGYKAVIVDEAHHAASKSWRVVLNHFDDRIWVEGEESSHAADSTSTSTSLKTNTHPNVPIIGFSATFSRHDGLSLGSVFEEIVFHKDILDLIDEAFLSPLRFTSIQAQIPLDTIALAGGSGGSDFSTTSLARAINTPPINKLIVRSWLSRTQADDSRKRSRTLIFAVNIQHVKDLTEQFREAGIDARYLTGSTLISERKQLINDFGNGDFPVLINCAILTEGADIPSIDCVLLARPTLSRNLFSQMIGRGMRLSPSSGKEDCLIMDLVGNCSKGLVCTPTLFGLDPSEALEDVTTEDLLERRESNNDEEKLTKPHLDMNVGDPTKLTFIDYDSAKALHEAMSSKVLFHNTVERYSSNAWLDCGGDVYVLDVPPNRGYVRVEREVDMENQTEMWLASFTPANSDEDEARAANPFQRGKRVSPYRRPRKVLEAETLEQAVRGSDTYVSTQVLRSSQLMRSLMSRHAEWRKAPASTKQRAFVEKRLGFTRKGNEDESKDGLTTLTKGEASMILTRLKHGSKGRWQSEAKRQNKVWEAEEKIRERKERETVKVGRL
ncbi:hypothetical protein CBS101457_005623 [Exobasidium rhododendri]|nr:hypothetical protein CBS101457_005623 [Exobasidium rhododendri]